MATELFYFDGGINLKKSPLFLKSQSGEELVSSSGFSYANDGVLAPRASKTTVNVTPLGTINNIHRYMNRVLSLDSSKIYYKWDLDGYCNLYTPANGNFTEAGSRISKERARIVDAEEFSFIVPDKKVFASGNLYDWDIHNPLTAPAGTAGASGNPSGTYTLYCTYLIKFPNGREHETGPSPAGTVTVTSQQISWTNIDVCPYTGTGLTIHRKLYRTSSALEETYYVTTIADNTTTTYTDNESDATLELNDVISTEDYDAPPDNINDVAWHLFRVFAISGPNIHWSEPYLPFAFGLYNYAQACDRGEDLVCVVRWGEQLHYATKHTWKRLQGTDPAKWESKSTFAEHGVINANTVIPTRWGVIGLGYDGIYIYDGMTSKNFTEKKLPASFFTTTISSLSACYAEFDGNRYKFIYPTSGTTLDKCLILDFSTYPNIRIYHEDFIPTAYQHHDPSGIEYWAKTTYQYKDGGTETVATSLRTGDRVFNEVVKQKSSQFLFYDIDTGGKAVSVGIYVDDTLQETIILNETSRIRSRTELGRYQGYRYSIEISCSDSTGVSIYSPWAIEASPTGY